MGGTESCGHGQADKVSKAGAKHCSSGAKLWSVDRNDRYSLAQTVAHSTCINFTWKPSEVRHGQIVWHTVGKLSAVSVIREIWLARYLVKMRDRKTRNKMAGINTRFLSVCFFTKIFFLWGKVKKNLQNLYFKVYFSSWSSLMYGTWNL